MTGSPPILTVLLSCTLATGVHAQASALSTRQLTADFSDEYRHATHVASGALYGLGADGEPDARLLRDINPLMFTKMAPGGTQVPVGDALRVASMAAAARSIDRFDYAYLRNFLSFSNANGVLPDIVSWHELGGPEGSWQETTNIPYIGAHIKKYCAIENSLGIAPLQISIKEFGVTNEKGVPGSMIGYIAQFERGGVEIANMAFWFTPGKLSNIIVASGGLTIERTDIKRIPIELKKGANMLALAATAGTIDMNVIQLTLVLPVVRIEAERAMFVNALIKPSSHASSQFFVAPNTVTGSFVEFRLEVPAVGMYMMDIGYSSTATTGGGRSRTVNGGAPKTLAYGSTGGHFQNVPINYPGRIKPMAVALNEGRNVVRLDYRGVGYVEVDYIELRPAVARYEAEAAALTGAKPESSATASGGRFICRGGRAENDRSV